MNCAGDGGRREGSDFTPKAFELQTRVSLPWDLVFMKVFEL
jgi:hypothetical protein